MALNPAAWIIEALGGEKVVSEATGTSYTAPYRWQSPTAKGGTGGRVPSKHIPTLLKLAGERSIEIPAEAFFVEPSVVEKKSSEVEAAE